MTVELSLGSWVSTSATGKKFHFVINGHSLCGRSCNGSVLPSAYIMPRVQHICLKCETKLFKIGLKNHVTRKRGV